MEKNGQMSESVPKDEPHIEGSSFGRNIESLLSGLIGMLFRWFGTLALFALSPKRVATVLGTERPDFRHVLRPYTFLFIGCLLYSFVLSSVPTLGRALRVEADAERILEMAQREFGESFSFTATLIRTLPLLVILALSGWLAARPIARRATNVQYLYFYLYGLQAGLLFLLLMSLYTVFSAIDVGDIPLLIMVLILFVLLIQGLRSLRRIIPKGTGWPTRTAVYLLFPVFYLAPLPLAGYAIEQAGLFDYEESRAAPQPPLPAVRFLDAKYQADSNTHIRFLITALVENPTNHAMLITPERSDLYVVYLPERLQSYVQVIRDVLSPKEYRDIKETGRRFKALRIAVDRLLVNKKVEDAWVLTPGDAVVVRIEAQLEESKHQRRARESAQTTLLHLSFKDSSWRRVSIDSHYDARFKFPDK